MDPVIRYNHKSSILNEADLNSLTNLSKIKTGEVVDVYDNGTISKPYDSKTWGSTLWRSGRYAAGLSQNRDDIPKIKQLMQRAMTDYLRTKDESLRRSIQNSLQGLTHLKVHYQNKNIEKVSSQIQDIINFVNDFLTTEVSFPETKLDNKRYHELAQLEASKIVMREDGREEGVVDAYEGVHYFVDRIRLFLSVGQGLSEEERAFLLKIQSTLENAGVWGIKGFSFLEECAEKGRVLKSKNPDLDVMKLFDMAQDEVISEKVAKLLDTLDTMNPLDAEQIGIPIPMGFKWNEEDGSRSGHAFFLCLCKNKDGLYTAAQINAGGLTLADITQTKWHLNFNVPYTLWFPPVVEFPALNKSEAFDFLKTAVKNSETEFKSYENAKERYNKIFEPINAKVSVKRIPERRSQVIGNCGVRSLKELLIYMFQKAGQVELANKFLLFGIDRGGSLASFDPVQSLKSD